MKKLQKMTASTATMQVLEKREHNNSVDNGHGVRKSDNCIKTQVVLEPDFETMI